MRSHALAAVVALFPKRGEPLVVAALGDRSQDVRVAAASIAAERKLKSAIAPLLSLLRRGAVEAIAPLGQLADAEVARQVAELISVVEDSLVAQALGAMLLNPAFGPDPVRVEVVFALAGMPGDESVKVLKKYVDAVPEQPHRESRDEAVIAIDKRVSGGGR